MPALETTITEIGGCALLIIDPVVSAAAGDSHKNSETRRGLQPLVDLGAKHRTAIIGIHHFSKGTAGRDPLERFNGSLAFGAIPRIGLVASKSPVRGAEKSARRVIMRAKSNIGPDDGGFYFELQFAPMHERSDIIAAKVAWGEAVKGNAAEILADAEAQQDDEKLTGISEAKEFLLGFLAGGKMPTKPQDGIPSESQNDAIFDESGHLRGESEAVEDEHPGDADP
jgi:putative DNA primase/helicase